MIYGLSASWGGIQAADVQAHAITAYNIIHEGEWTRGATVYAENTTFLSEEGRLNRGLFSGYINDDGRLVSQYPPGVPLISAPIMLFSDLDRLFGY